MGRFYEFQCKKGKFRLRVALGIGMRFPQVYDEIMSNGRNGKYGEEVQKFLHENPDGVLDVSKVLVKCTSCGQYEVVPDLTMYLPKDSSQRKKFPFAWILHEYYDIAGTYRYKCSHCGGDVEIFKEEDFKLWRNKITCPYCHGQTGVARGFWD